MMKKLVISGLILLSSLAAYSQDTIAPKKFSLGVGVSRVFGWGQNTNLSYAASKKFSIRLRGIYGVGNESLYNQQNYYGADQKISNLDISISTNYFILGNTNSNCKASLYIGLGLGYLQQTSNTTNLYPGNFFSSNNPNGSYIEKDISRGLAGNTNIGAAFKLGPGKIYAEVYFSMSFIGETTTSYTYMSLVTNNSNSSYLQTHIYKEDFEPEAILCFNLGYAIPF